jgi:hypothetical protein
MSANHRIVEVNRRVCGHIDLFEGYMVMARRTAAAARDL